MRRAIITILVFWSSVAAAGGPTFEILDRGEAVEVIAHDLKAARTAITPTRQRLEIELAGMPNVPSLSPPSGGIVKVIELDGSEARRLSIKLNFERPQVKTLARFAQAIQVGNDLHVMFPKTVPAEGASVVLPDPTVPPELAQKLQQPQPQPQASAPAPALIGPPPNPAAPPAPQPAPKAAPPPAAAPPAQLTAKAEPKPEPAAEQKPEPEPTAAIAPPAKAPTLGTAPPSDDTWGKLATYGALGLGALGCGIWFLRRRKAGLGPTSSIDVIAQRSLGGKAKVVWLAAGGREMVVAVTHQNVRMLSQWEKQEPLPRAQTVQPDSSPPSEAVAGILRLRAKTNAPFHEVANGNDGPRPRARTYIPEINEEVATDDVEADTAWAREILAATGGRR